MTKFNIYSWFRKKFIKLGIKGIILNLIKGIYKTTLQLTSYLMVNGRSSAELRELSCQVSRVDN